MPYVERYFAQRHFDSSFEPCLKKSRLDYSALCKKKKTEEFIPLEAPSESSSGFSETRHYGSVKGQREKPRVSEDFLNGLDNEAKGGSSRNYNAEAHFSRKESKLDYLELCTKRNSEEFIPLGTRSENCSPSGFSENSYYGSDKSEYEKERDSENFQNDFDNEEESGPYKNYSSETHSTRIKSKPDNSALSKKRNNEEYISLETQSENRSPSGFSETRCYGSDKGKHEKSRFGEDFKIGFYIDKKPGLSKNYCSEPPLSWTEDSNKNQQILGLPKTDKWQNNNSEAAFSETSTAFIGPLYQPPPPVDTVSKTTNNENSKSPSFRITTVVSGKAAGRTKSEGGMDYEMRQFYKELNQLEAATDDHNVIQTTANSQQHCSSHQSSAPTIQEVRDHHNQKPSSQLCNPISLALNPPSYHPTEAPISPAEHPTLPPINNQDYCNRPVPIYRTSSSFVSWSLPPPSFEGPPPPAFDRTDSSFVSQSLPPPCFQSPLPPAFDRTNSFVSQPLPPPCFQGPPPAFDRTNSSHLSQSLPPPCFQGPPPPAFNRTNASFVSQPLRPACYQGSPPPAFEGNNGPTPPRHNYPLIFPREDDIRNSPYHENEKYRSVNEDYPRPTTQAPWHSSHVLPENRLSPQGRSFTEPVPRPPFESSQQAYQREDFYEQKGRSFNEILPQGGNVFHEQYPPKYRDEAKCTDSKKKLVLLRGVPGSGKSTLASILLDQSPNGIVFSTDDYFCQENGYSYDVKLLGDAHNWNQKRAQRAMDDGMSPIIIDNTNIQSWEMKPYVQMALEGGYAVEFLEPNTWWKLDPHELEKRNTHRVPREKISQMLDRFEHNMNVGVVMNSVEPRRVRHRRPPSENRQRWGASVDYTSHSSSFQIR